MYFSWERKLTGVSVLGKILEMDFKSCVIPDGQSNYQITLGGTLLHMTVNSEGNFE